MKCKLFENIKSMDRCNRTSLILVIVCAFLLTVMTIMNISQIIDYNKNRQSGNDKWLMVEDYLKSYEVRLHDLEERLDNLDYKQGG